MIDLAASLDSRSQTEKIIEVFFLALLFVIAFLSNSTIFCAMLQPFRLRSPSNIFILFLVTSSLCLTLLHTPFAIATVVMDQWPFAFEWCRTSGFLINVLSMASNLFTVTIAVHRYYLIVKPLPVTLSIRKARIMVGFVWFTSFITAFPPVFGWSSYQYIPGKAFCTVDWEDGGPSLVYSFYLVTASFLVPFAILVYIYRSIYLKTKRQRIKTDYNTLKGLDSRYVSDDPFRDTTVYQKMLNWFQPRNRRRSQYSFSSPTSTSSGGSLKTPETPGSFLYTISQKEKEIKTRRNTVKQSLKRPSSVYEQKTVQSALILLVTFLINSLPYYVVGLWSGLSQSSPSMVLDFIVTWFFVSMAAVNPILYGFMNRQIRRVVRKSTIGRFVCRVCNCCNEDFRICGFYSVSGRERTSDGLESGR